MPLVGSKRRKSTKLPYNPITDQSEVLCNFKSGNAFLRWSKQISWFNHSTLISKLKQKNWRELPNVPWDLVALKVTNSKYQLHCRTLWCKNLIYDNKINQLKTLENRRYNSCKPVCERKIVFWCVLRIPLAAWTNLGN